MTRRTLLWGGAAASLGWSQTRQERGKKVIDEALAALGGEKFQAVKDRIEAGRAYSFYRERLTGLSVAKIYTRYLTPGKPGTIAVRERQAFGKEENIITLFLENEAYQLSFRGARPVPAPLLQRYRDSTLHNVFYIFRQRMDEPGLLFESQGTDIVDNQPVENVDIIDGEGRVTSVSFHRSLKLPVRQTFFRRDPETKERIEEVAYFSKYRDVGNGSQWPFTINRQRNGEKVFELYSDTVSVNQNLTDNLFTLPADKKVLPPAR